MGIQLVLYISVDGLVVFLMERQQIRFDCLTMPIAKTTSFRITFLPYGLKGRTGTYHIAYHKFWVVQIFIKKISRSDKVRDSQMFYFGGQRKNS